jgi:hypothetical protein
MKMTKWEFLFGSDRVEVDGTTWLDALGKALGAAGLDSTVLTRLHIDVQPGDRVVVKDPAGRKMVLQPVPAGDKSQPDMDLFNIPPDLETEEIPRANDGRPMPRRGPKPRATNWRVPTPTKPPPSTLTAPRPMDPGLAAPPMPANLEADEPPTEEVDPKQLASALAAAHAHTAPAKRVPQKPAPPRVTEPAPTPAPPAPPKPGRTKPRRPLRGAPTIPAMAPPMAPPLAGPAAAIHDAPPSPLEAPGIDATDAPVAVLEAPAPPPVIEAPEAVEAPRPPVIDPAYIPSDEPDLDAEPETEIEPEVELEPASEELPLPPVIQPVAQPVPPPPPAGILPVVPRDPADYAPTPEAVQQAVAPRRREQLAEPVPVPPEQATVEPPPAPPSLRRADTQFDMVDIPPPPPPPTIEPTPAAATDIDQLAESLSPLLGQVMENLEHLETAPPEAPQPPAVEDLPPAPAALEPELLDEEEEVEELPPPPVVEPELAEEELPPPPVVEPAVLEEELPPPPVVEPAVLEEELPPPPVVEPELAEEELPPPPVVEPAVLEEEPPPPPVVEPAVLEEEPPPPPAPAPPPVVEEHAPPPPAPAPPPALQAEPVVDQVLVAKPALEPIADDDLPPGFGDDDEPVAVDMDVFGPAKPIMPEDLGEWLFEKSMDINEAMDIPDAARMSLQILLDLVGAESGCVLYGDYNAEALEFIAAAGPTAHKLQGVKVEIENSLAGFCHRMGFGVLVADAATDNRFDRSVDEHTGYSTEAILAVPIRATDGDTYGCMELLNAYWGFEEWMMDASQNIATTLAGYIQARL